MELKVSRNSDLSIHVQLKEQIKGLVLDGILQHQEQLPTVRQLGEFLQINKNTVSKVYKELENEGYVESQKGRGTFVSYKKDLVKVQFLEEIEINEKDVLKGLTEKAFNMDYFSCKDLLYKYLVDLKSQIEETIF